MNGFANRGLDEGNFGDDRGAFSVKAFDAFPKTKSSYLQRTRNGGTWTALLICITIWLASSEVRRWWAGQTMHTFSVEKGISHDLQINLDVVVAMQCEDLHVNIQDAAGDRILAGDKLRKDPTLWDMWGGKKDNKNFHRLGNGAQDKEGYEVEDVHDYLGANKGKRKFAKTPKMGKGSTPDSCRIYGSVEGNKVQGDFHITARGHGYLEMGLQHLDHSKFNFSHKINELSFGPFYPTLVNPLDDTLSTTESHFFKYQYYLSIVPTFYHDNSRFHTPLLTNQYAVTSQSRNVDEQQVPGVFVKFDIEPILLEIGEESIGVLSLLVRLVNVVSGVLVAGGWLYQLVDWAGEVVSRRRRSKSEGVLNGRGSMDEDRGDGQEKAF